MLRVKRPTKPRQMENTITLINIVFLMLIFFLIAGTTAPDKTPDVNAVETSDAEKAEQEKLLGIRQDGTLVYRGEETNAAAYSAIAREEQASEDEMTIRLLPDRDLPAVKLLEAVSALHEASGAKIVIFSERAQR